MSTVEEILRLLSTEAKLWRRPALGGAQSIMEPKLKRVDQLEMSVGLEQIRDNTVENSAAMCCLAERGMCLTTDPENEG
jgi:hypothetical protein